MWFSCWFDIRSNGFVLLDGHELKWEDLGSNLSTIYSSCINSIIDSVLYEYQAGEDGLL